MTTVQTPADRLPSAAALSGIGSKLQQNLLFLVLVILGNSVGALMLIGAAYAMATQDHFTGASLYFGYLADGIPAALFAAAAALAVVVTIRTWKMLSAARAQNQPNAYAVHQAEARQKGARLVAFPESFLPGSLSGHSCMRR